MSTVTADPTPEERTAELLVTFRDMEAFLTTHPDQSGTLPVFWQPAELQRLIDLATSRGLTRVAALLRTYLATHRQTYAPAP